MAGRLDRKSAASAPALAGPARSRSRIARRVGSAMARNTSLLDLSRLVAARGIMRNLTVTHYRDAGQCQDERLLAAVPDRMASLRGVIPCESAGSSTPQRLRLLDHRFSRGTTA